jgi:hypothetical protein
LSRSESVPSTGRSNEQAEISLSLSLACLLITKVVQHRSIRNRPVKQAEIPLARWGLVNPSPHHNFSFVHLLFRQDWIPRKRTGGPGSSVACMF